MDNGRINIPVPLLGQQGGIKFTPLNQPFADPQLLPVNTPHGLEIFITGGIGRIEEMALRLIESGTVTGIDMDETAADAVYLARAIVRKANEPEEEEAA